MAMVSIISCGEAGTPREVTAPTAQQAIAEAMGPGAALDAFALLSQQLAWAGQIPGGAAVPPTCTIIRALSPSLGFDRQTKVGNCGACVVGSPVLAVATSGAGAAGNTAVATARCGSVDVAGPVTAVDPGASNVQLNASAGLQVAGVPACARSYSGGAPPSNRSFVCIFF